MAAVPDYGALLGVLWGNWFDGATSLALAAASGIVTGTNPPYGVADFFSMYPAFSGKTLSGTADTNSSTNVLANCTFTAGLVVGAAIAGPNIPLGAFVTAISSNNVTISKTPTATATGVSISAWPSPNIPLPVLGAYILLAQNSILQSKYEEMWSFVIGLFIAHYCQLWVQSQATTPNSNAQQVAASGMALGIKISKAAGNVSVGLQPLIDLEGWGAFQLTLYGQQFATIAKTLGSLPMFLL